MLYYFVYTKNIHLDALLEAKFSKFIIHFILLERQWRLQRCSSVPGNRDPEGQRGLLCCRTIRPRMADSAAQCRHLAGQSTSPE